MRYGYKGYWTEVCPVYDETKAKVLYWRYRIFSFATNESLLDGYDGDRPSALATAQAHIELLARDAAAPALRVA